MANKVKRRRPGRRANCKTVKTKSGRRGKCKRFKIRFYEFQRFVTKLTRGELSDLNVGYPPLSPDAEEFGGYLIGKDQLKGKWIYVFIRKPKKNKSQDEVLEIRADEEGKYWVANWNEKTLGEYSNENERPWKGELGGEKVTIYIEWGEDTIHMCLSQIRLPTERLKAYLGKRGGDHVQRRCFELDFDHLHKRYVEGGVVELEVYLIDYIKIAKQLQTRYLETSRELEKYVADDDRAVRLHLAKLTLSVVQEYAKKESEAWSWLRKKNGNQYSDVVLYINGEAEEIKKREDAFREASETKYKFMTKNRGLLEVQHDYDSGIYEEKIIETSAFLIKDSHKSAAGQKLLEEIVTDETNWYSKLLLDDNLFSTGRKTFSTSAGVTESVLTIYEQWAMGAVKNREKVLALLDRIKRPGLTARRNFLQEITNILEIRITDLNDFAKLPNGKYFVTVDSSKGVLPNVIRFRLKEETEGYINRYTTRVERLKNYRGTLSANSLRIMFALNMINWMSSWQKLEKARESGESWDTTNAVLELISASGDMISSSAIILRKSGAKPFVVVGAITSVINYACDLSKLSQAVYQGKPGMAIGHIVSAVGSTCSIIAAATAAGSVAAAAWWTGIGLVIALGAAVLILVFQESPLEKWVKSSPWGVDEPVCLKDGRPAGRNSLVKATRELYELIADFKLSVYPSSPRQPRQYITVKVEPGMLTESSKLMVDLTIFASQEKPYFKKRWNALSEGSVHRENGRIVNSLRTLGKEEIEKAAGSRLVASTLGYVVEAELDMMGDGEYRIPGSSCRGRWFLKQLKEPPSMPRRRLY